MPFFRSIYEKDGFKKSAAFTSLFFGTHSFCHDNKLIHQIHLLLFMTLTSPLRMMGTVELRCVCVCVQFSSETPKQNLNNEFKKKKAVNPKVKPCFHFKRHRRTCDYGEQRTRNTCGTVPLHYCEQIRVRSAFQLELLYIYIYIYRVYIIQQR